MTQPWLYMRHKSTAHGTVAVFKDIDRQLIQIGPPFGTDEYTGTNGQYQVTHGRVAHWNNDIYAVNGNNGIYRYNQASGTWDLAYNWSPVASNITSARIGLTPCSLNGSGVLVCGYPSSTASWRPVFIYGDGSFAEPFGNRGFQEDGWTYNPTDNTKRGPYGMVSHRNFLYFMINDLTFGPAQLQRENINRFNLETGAVNVIDQPSNQYGGTLGHLCVHNDAVFYIGQQGQTGPVHIHRVDGTTLTNITSFAYDGLGTGTTYSGQSLFSINGRLIAVFTRATQTYLYEIVLDENNNFVAAIDRSADVLGGTGLRNSGGAQWDPNNKFYLKVDTITDPENPAYFLDVMEEGNTEGGTVYYYSWPNAPTGTLQFIAAGLDPYRFDKNCMNSNTGGERVWGGSGTLNASAPRLTLDGPNIKCAFTVYGVAQTGIKAQVVFDKEGEIPSTIGTLVTTTSGSIVGKVVEGLVANGLGEVEISWAAALDGITPGDNPSVAIRVFA